MMKTLQIYIVTYICMTKNGFQAKFRFFYSIFSLKKTQKQNQTLSEFQSKPGNGKYITCNTLQGCRYTMFHIDIFGKRLKSLC
jgi:hypothetical protein